MTASLSSKEAGPFAYTPGPWRVGSWGGFCDKQHASTPYHPGPGGEDGCVYTYKFQPATLDDGYMPGIAGPESRQMVVETSYDSLSIRMPDAVLIAAAPEMYEALKHIASHFDEKQKSIEWCNTTVAEVRAAIAKAEGR